MIAITYKPPHQPYLKVVLCRPKKEIRLPPHRRANARYFNPTTKMSWLTRHTVVPPAGATTLLQDTTTTLQTTPYSIEQHNYSQQYDMHSMWQQQPAASHASNRYTHGPSANTSMQRTNCIPSHHGMEPTHNLRVSSLLPPAETSQTPPARPPTSTIGCSGATDSGAWHNETARFQDERADLHDTQNAWQCLLEDIRSAVEPITNQPREGSRKRSRHGEPSPSIDDCSEEEEDGGVVELQPQNRVLLPQSNRETCTSMWVVNSADWIDVEHILRRMLKCESSECHAFYPIGYVFFRSCAVSHVSAPSDFLQDGTFYRFPGTEVVVAITRAHAEGVLQVECYLEYRP